ncbi:MAG: hypothetical protein JWP91_636 [Fibrobacteres bacterium]|nr:hypothetical protein [Fibrobacterota bacterium]
MCWAAGAGAQTPIVAVEPAQAGPDFPLVGEFSGTVSGSQTGTGTLLAAQIVAMGKGEFRAVFFPGGLPGKGWSGAGRAETPGKRNGTKAEFPASGLTAYSAVLSGDSLIGKGPGGAGFSLSRVTRMSPTLLMAAPAGTTVLFDGSNLDAWTTAVMDSSRQLRPALGAAVESGAVTRKSFGAWSLHVEFRTPFKPDSRGQDRGNSGVVMNSQGWGEIQILDSFGNPPAKDECGGIYNTAPALVMACLPPLTWQTYDIQWTPPVIAAGGARTQEGKMTAWLNGIKIQDGQAIAGLAALSPITLQQHNNPVVFRNVWIAEGNDHYPFFAQVSILPRTRSRESVSKPAWGTGRGWSGAFSGLDGGTFRADGKAWIGFPP